MADKNDIEQLIFIRQIREWFKWENENSTFLILWRFVNNQLRYLTVKDIA